jgi:predicted dehydrogenase
MGGIMPFRIAVVGCGNISFSHHGPAYQKYAADHTDTELRACCDLDPERSRKFAEAFGFSNSYSDWQVMLKREHPDAVCLNVPPAQTADLACQILRLGYPLHLEKPPGLNQNEINAMIQAAEESNVPNQVAFNRRFMPLLTRLRELVAAAAPRSLYTIRCEFCRQNRQDPDFSTTAVHAIDAVRFLAGSDYKQVDFIYQDIPDAGLSVANIFLQARFASGLVAHLSFLPLSGLVAERYEIHLRDHAFYLSTPIWTSYDFPGSLTQIHQGKEITKVTGPELSFSQDDFLLSGFYQEDASFFDDIRTGKRPQHDIVSGRQAVIISQAIRERRQNLFF